MCGRAQSEHGLDQNHQGVVLSMCFSRTTFSREQGFGEVRDDPVWRLVDREHDTERPRPITDRERAEREAEDSREEIPVGARA